MFSSKTVIGGVKMLQSSGFYVPLATKKGFNASVQHIQNVLEVLDLCDPKKNTADEIGILLENKELSTEQVPAFLSVLLLDLWGYTVVSQNLTGTINNAEAVISEMGQWKGVDIILGYHHPDLGFLAFNPKNPSNKMLLESIRKNELLIVYVGQQDKGPISEKAAHAVIKGIFKLFEGKKVKMPQAVLSGSFVYTAPKPPKVKTTASKRKKAVKQTKSTAVQKKVAAEPVRQDVPDSSQRVPSGAINMSRQISVIVTNELFHNGNVEAWKRIIRSYTARYPKNRVIVFYDGEQIVDINTLFKWGKVKHGSAIHFAVAGEEIKDLSKLSKYFAEGASPRFEAFLRGSPSTVLNLF